MIMLGDIMKKIIIGMFTDSFFPMVDGVAVVIDNYAKRLSKIANVIVFCPKYNNKKCDDSKFDYKVVRCMSTKFPFIDYNLATPKLDLKFEKEINKYDLDIIHIHSPFSVGKLGAEYAKKNNIPLVGTMHSQYKQDFLRAVRSETMANIMTKEIIKVYDKCDRCFTVNDEVARIYCEEYGSINKPVIIRNATDMTLLESVDSYIDKKYNIKNDEKVFLFVGRINALKNVFFIVDALKILKEKDIKFKMLFVGTGQDEDNLEEYIKENNLEDNIIMCGSINDREMLRKYYKRADLFLFPSLYDTNSLVQIEAASQKTPGVFLRESATSATIEDNVTGFLTDSNSEDYADKIIEVINNKKLYDKVCENVYNKIYITWDDTVKDLFKNYEEVLKELE